MSKVRTKIEKDDHTHYSAIMRKKSGNPMEGRTFKPPPAKPHVSKERKGPATPKLVMKPGHYPKRAK